MFSLPQGCRKGQPVLKCRAQKDVRDLDSVDL
jgi:hypothetical protein